MSQLIVVVLTHAQACHDVVHVWEDLGVPGATILDSASMRHAGCEPAPRDDLPLMPSLRAILESDEIRQRTLFSVMPDDFDLDNLIARTEEQIGSFNEPGSGILFVVPVTRVLGLACRTTS
jgi:hypothetical protein